MAWKRLTVDDLRLALAEDEIEKLSTRSLDSDIQDVLQDQLDMAADAFRGAWLSKGYEVDVREHFVAPEYRQFVLDYARYQIWTRFPMAEDYALSKPREESWKQALDLLKNPYIATSKPDYSDDPEAAEEAARRKDASVAMPWLRMPGEAGEYGFPKASAGQYGSSSGGDVPAGKIFLRYLDQAPAEPKLGDVCKSGDEWIIFVESGWQTLSKLGIEWSDISAVMDYGTISAELDLSSYAGKTDVELVPCYGNAWDVSGIPEGYSVKAGPEGFEDAWILVLNPTDDTAYAYNVPENPSEITFDFSSRPGNVFQGVVVATRTAKGWYLSGQENKKLQPMGDYVTRADVIDPANATETGKAADAMATGTALAARPTKAQMDEGWWSEWVCEPSQINGVPVSIKPLSSGWTVYLGDSFEGMGYIGDENSSSLVFVPGESTSLDVPITATRHRVAAPIPTKPGDIGAQPLLTFDQTPTANSANPVTSGGVKSALDGKLDSTAAAPAVLSTQTYAEGEYATHGGKLYVCSAAVSSPGDWPQISSNWEETDMTSPDATLDVTADGALRVVAADGAVLWRQGYNMALSSSATLSNECVNKYTFDQNPTSAVALTLPVVPYGKCADFVLDAVAPAAVSAAFDLDLNFNSFVVDSGKDLQDVVSMQAGEIARYWFTLTTFDIGSKPTWQVSKTVVVSGDLS